MIITAYNETHPYLLFIDLEFFSNKEGFDYNNHLIQFAGLLFKQIDDNTYQLMRSCNEYVADTVCYPFAEYTSITNNFLAENGIPLKDLVASVQEDFLGDINLDDILLISHGLKNDRSVMAQSGLKLLTSQGAPVTGYCTFANGRKILKRQDHLTLGDIAAEAGYYLHHAHNAFNDVWATVSVYTYLKKIEKQEEKPCTL